MIQFDYYFSNALKPPTRCFVGWNERWFSKVLKVMTCWRIKVHCSTWMLFPFCCRSFAKVTSDSFWNLRESFLNKTFQKIVQNSGSWKPKQEITMVAIMKINRRFVVEQVEGFHLFANRIYGPWNCWWSKPLLKQCRFSCEIHSKNSVWTCRVYTTTKIHMSPEKGPFILKGRFSFQP